MQVICLSLLTLALASPTPQTPGVTPLVNAPVAPEAIYVGRTGALNGLSVIDLNGFGQGTGNPVFLPNFGPASEGTSMYPWNPNVAFQGTLLTPPQSPGTTTLDGGSAGVFTLTRDTNLNDLLNPASAFGQPGDMMLGRPLDVVYNDGPPPFGCQSGGGSLCSTTGLQLIGAAAPPSPGQGPVPIQMGTGSFGSVGLGNPISWAPAPNPPRLLTTPLCQQPEILGQEPISIDSYKLGLTNLLAPGDPCGNPGLGVPPSGLLSSTQTAYFIGPSPPQVQVSNCNTYQLRQQVGQFLYVIDRRTNKLKIMNSNRMTVLSELALPDPTELAMDPNLHFLAVTNRNTDSVTIIDTDPYSPKFHQVIKTIAVGDQPVGIAWQPDGEDLLVCNAGDSTLSVISATSFLVRKTVQVGTRHGFALAVTPRHTSFGSKSNVYYAYILDVQGQVWLFESGPDGANGWGYDDIVTRTGFSLPRARALQLDPNDPAASFWVVHEGSVDLQGKPTGLMGGAVTKLTLTNPLTGQVPIVPGSSPDARGKQLVVQHSIGSNVLTGRPTDLAFDNLHNLGVYISPMTPFSPSGTALTNGKHPMRDFGTAVPTNNASYLFLPVVGGQAGAGAVDVIDLSNGKRVDTNAFQPGTQSIPAPGAYIVMDYFRQ